MINPNRPKALQTYLLADTTLKWYWAKRIWFLKVATGEWPAIVFNEWGWNALEWANISYEKWIDMFPVLIDIVVKYNDFKKWYDIRNHIRKLIWSFDWKLSKDWEWIIVFRQVIAPSYNPETDEIVFGSVYLFKQHFDYTPDPEPTPTLDNQENNNANNPSEELNEQSDSDNQ